MKIKQYGFTLVELLVAMAVVAIISTVVMANFRGAERVKKVQLAVDIVVSAVRSAQNIALSGRQISGCTSGDPIMVTMSQPDINDPSSLPASQTIKVECQSVLIQSYTLPTTIKFDRFFWYKQGWAGGPGNPNQLTLFFYPPFAAVRTCTTAIAPDCETIDFMFADIAIVDVANSNLRRGFRIEGATGLINGW